jgi:hypothetical protein
MKIENKVDVAFAGQDQLLFEEPVFPNVAPRIVSGGCRDGKQGEEKQDELQLHHQKIKILVPTSAVA